jgi:uncharacterized protein
MLARISLLTLASVLVSLVFVVLDAATRHTWPSDGRAGFLLASVGLHLAAGTLLGLTAACVVEFERWLTSRAVPSLGRRIAGRAAVYATLVGFCSAPLTAALFAGRNARSLSVVGPLVLSLGLALVAGTTGIAILRSGARRAVQLALVFSAAICVYLDLAYLVALYPTLHAVLQLAAWLFGVGAASLALSSVANHARTRLLPMLALGSTLWTLSLALAPVRHAVERAARHAWVDAGYAGRLLALATQPPKLDSTGYGTFSMSRLDALRERYALRELELDPRWVAPPPTTLGTERARLRAPLQKPNLVIFYVDTLRADVARDPAVMPNVARFRRSALDFSHAYAAGSDTLRSLPALMSGKYAGTIRSGLLQSAEAGGYTARLVIPRSAHEYLAVLCPSFHFPDTDVVRDFEDTERVWGYGAKRATAGDIVSSMDRFLMPHSPPGYVAVDPAPGVLGAKKPFFYFLFNYDVHNWREIAGSTSGYRDVARGVDAAFGRLLDALESTGRTEDTIVVFVSDHGEGLGENGFQAHSVFLWESLLRVPLLVRIPGIAAREIATPVSLVDLAPTLVPYLSPNTVTAQFHGEDLLAHLVSPKPERRYPLLASAALLDALLRVALIDPVSQRKLVVNLDSPVPELYDLTRVQPDGANLLDREPERARALLDTLVHSPVFPRKPEDLDLLQGRGRKVMAERR